MRLTVLAAALVLGATAALAAQLPVEARLPWESSSPGMAPVNLNADSSDELLVYDGDNYVVGRDQQLQVSSASRRFSTDTRRAGPPFGVNETLMWVPRTRNDSLFLWPLWHGREVFCFTVPSHRPGDFWDGAVSELALQDLDGDGPPELVVLVIAGFAKWPRGVAAFDLKTGQRRWFFPTGPNPTGLVLRDVDGDGNVEVMFGSIAPGNGHKVPGSDDDHSYVFCFRPDGSLLWQREIGFYGQAAHVEWFDGHLLVNEQGHPVEQAELDSVFILDPRTGMTQAAAPIGKHGRGVVAGGDSLIVSVATDDTLRVYDAALNILRAVALKASGATGICRGSFTAPGRVELAVATTKGILLLYDLSIHLLAESPAARVTSMRPLANGGRHRLLVEAYQDKQTFWRLYELDPLPLLKRPVTLWIALAGIGLLLVAFLAVLAGVRYRQTRDMRAVVRSLTGQAGVVELDHRGRVRHVNPKGRELLQLAGATEAAPFAGALAPLSNPMRDGSAPRELPLSLPTGQTILARATSVKTGTLLTLEDISAVEYMKRVTTWAPVAQKLAHDIKNPLTAMALTLQRLDKYRSPETDRYYTSMKDEIDRLKKMADGFMRLSKLEPPKLAPGSINDLVRSCLARFDSAKPPGINIVFELADDLPPVALDPEQLSVACSNIIENAISAMGNAGEMVVRTSFVVDSKRVAVIVSDTGKGIPERYLDKVFDPYFTLKPGGTGLGMAITKRITEDHKGTISIQSKEGKGTTVTITLPAATYHA